MSPELNLVALCVGAALVLVAVHLFQRAQVRWVFLQDLSAIADGRVVQLVFLAFIGLMAVAGKALGIVLPEYVTRFLPSAVEALVGGLLVSETYRAARRPPQ